ncbi:selenium cofactor biosynthesis protein YqeC [Chloroflexota bacterium]
MKLSHALRITSGDVIALTGGGGKTTTMFRLAGELVRKQMRVLTTTSTRIFTGQIEHAPVHVPFDPAQQSVADILPVLDAASVEHGQVLLVRPIEPGSSKAVGIPAETIDALAATGHFEAIIVEADGARSHPFKAPATHEPVIPARTTIVVPVVGLEVVGQPLNDDTVHRSALASQLSDTQFGQPVTIDTIATVLGHPRGGLKNVPPQARVIPVLNKAESPSRMAAARNIATKLLAGGPIDAVAIGSVQAADQPILEVQSRTAVIILAAGGSTRFGSPKQLAPWGQQTFIERVVDVGLASQARPVVVVLGAEVEQSRAVLADKPVEVVVNENWASGQSTSLKAGLKPLPKNVGSVIFMLVDQPAVTPEVVDALIQRHRQTLAPVIWPEFAGKRGNPVLFDRSLFSQLRQISGDTGGRPLIKAYQDQAERVEVKTRAILQDFDRPDEVNYTETNRHD